MKQGWEVKKLEDVVDFQRGLTYSKKDEVDFSNNVVLRSNNVDLYRNELDFTELKYINPTIQIPESKKVKKGSLIICTANGSKSHLGKVALIDDDYDYAFGGFMGLITPTGKLNSKFLFYLMTSDSYKRFINELSDGANINNLKFGDLGQFEIPIPPLPEQERIVAILEECFAAIEKAKENAEQNLRDAKELFESYLNGIFENLRCDVKSIQDVANIINGYAFSSIDFNIGNSIKTIKITNVGVRCFIEENDNKLPHSYSDTYKEYQVHTNNIVIALTRTIISSGLKVSIVPESYDGALVNQRVAALIANKNIINNFFLYFYLTTRVVEKYVLEHVNTLMQPNLSINDLKKLQIPCPRIEQQNEIVKKLIELQKHVNNLEKNYYDKILHYDFLKNSILRKAFNGELITDNITL
jgi:type I restriction enzyme S subunit